MTMFLESIAGAKASFDVRLVCVGGAMARILVVEDEPMTAADLEQKLAALGHEVAAWRACETQPHGYLVKPFTERSVAATLQVALERARVERAQLERERWESTALHSAGEALVAVDTLGAVRFVNETGEMLLCVKAADVLGRDARSVVRLAEESLAMHPLDAALRERRVTSSSAHWLLTAEPGARLLVSCSAAFDVILCDLSMPEMSGQDLYERLCATRPELASRIIIMSGGALTDRSARFLTSMVGRRIDKPFRATELLPMLAQRMQAAGCKTSAQC
jgi:CheY-like chemotaxis protein